MTQPFNNNVAPRSPYTWGDLAKKIAKMTDEQRDHPIVIKLTDMDSSQWYFATIHATPENIMNDGEPTLLGPDDEPHEHVSYDNPIHATCILEVHSDYHFSTEYNDYCYFGLYEDK